jgi:hypothetical protein
MKRVKGAVWRDRIVWRGRLQSRVRERQALGQGFGLLWLVLWLVFVTVARHLNSDSSGRCRYSPVIKQLDSPRCTHGNLASRSYTPLTVKHSGRIVLWTKAVCN